MIDSIRPPRLPVAQDETEDNMELLQKFRNLYEGEIRMASEIHVIRAFASNGSTEYKEFLIPDGWEWLAHEFAIWTVNPPEGNRTGQVRIHVGTHRAPTPPYTVLAVWFEVSASVPPNGIGNYWIGTDLYVTLVRKEELVRLEATAKARLANGNDRS